MWPKIWSKIWPKIRACRHCFQSFPVFKSYLLGFFIFLWISCFDFSLHCPVFFPLGTSQNHPLIVSNTQKNTHAKFSEKKTISYQDVHVSVDQAPEGTSRPHDKAPGMSASVYVCPEGTTADTYGNIYT